MYGDPQKDNLDRSARPMFIDIIRVRQIWHLALPQTIGLKK